MTTCNTNNADIYRILDIEHKKWQKERDDMKKWSELHSRPETKKERLKRKRAIQQMKRKEKK
tara:strand:- start:782 stop:967 length:186 start_codon:yes stop_codon:yes gene_type:complete